MNLHYLSLILTLQFHAAGSIKAIANLYGPLMALNHMVQQEYFPKALAPLLLAFVTK